VNRRQLLHAAIVPLLASYAWAATARRFTVLYPELPAPERDIFGAIREGLQTTVSQGGGSIIEHAVTPATTASASTQLITQDSAEAIIALGRIATSLVEQTHPQQPVIAGATELAIPSPSLGGISLVVSPDRVFETLNEVAPRIRRVSVVLSPDRFGWLRPYMERAARARSLTLSIYEARSVAEAASHYFNILRYGNPQTDSLWLLEQGQFVTPDTLPHIIEDAWAARFAIFSSVLAHASEGALFALYMNPGSLGTRLGRIALDAHGKTPALLLDQAPLRAINARTAHHLAGVVDESRIHNFDLVLGDG
jgi:ABC-type uncharacterized transport system substrate-binding protein